jgi:hypothetical protein
MKLNLALLVFLFCVIAFTSCTIEKRIYEKGYHISWIHSVQRSVLQDASQELSQNLPKDLSSNLSQNLETDVSLDLSKKLCKSQDAETLSDTITPNKKDDDYFGQKNYTRDEANNVVPNTKNTKPQDISELKKETKDNFIAALIGFGGWGISLGLLSMNDWSTLDSIKAAIFLIVLGTACAILFLIFLPVAIFRLFKLAFLKLRGKPDDYKINQPKTQ